MTQPQTHPPRTPRGRGPWVLAAALIAALPVFALGLNLRSAIREWRDPYFAEKQRLEAVDANERTWIAIERERVAQREELDSYFWWLGFWDRIDPFVVRSAQVGIVVLTLGGATGFVYLCILPGIVAMRRRGLIVIPPDRVIMTVEQLRAGANLQLLADQERTRQIAAAHQPGQQPASLSYAPSTTYAPELEYRNHTHQEGGALPAADVAKPALAAPPFAALLGDAIAPGRDLVFGFDHETGELVTGTWLDLYSAGVGGLSGSGKSWTAASLLAQSAMQGARIVLLDPHAGNAESLTTRLQPIETCGTYLCKPAASLGEQDSAISMVAGELDRRKASGKAGEPVIIVADEFSALMRSSIAPELAGLFESIGQEGRKLGVFGLALGQVWTASRSGGSELRDSLASAFIHRSRPAQARYLTGLAAADLPGDLLDLPAGVCYLLSTAGELRKILIPRMQQSDIETVARMLGGSPAPGRQAEGKRSFGFQTVRAGRQPEGNGKATEELPATAPESQIPLPAEVSRILALFEAGKSISEIVADVYGVTSASGGRKYIALRDETETIIRRHWRGQRTEEGTR